MAPFEGMETVYHSTWSAIFSVNLNMHTQLNTHIEKENDLQNLDFRAIIPI